MAERPEDLNLPNAVVTRIIKDAIPEGVNVSKEARLAISKAASVFVLYATSISNNFAVKGKRKTINAQDVLSAMENMEFEQFIEPLQQCQEAFRQEKIDKKKERVSKPAPSATINEAGDEDVQEVSDEEESGEGRQSTSAADGSKEDFVSTVNENNDAAGSSGDSSVEMIEDGAD
ncbi:DNA polymerase epsilon subunit 3 [Elysia marginata]|uniref:DNA polymerase epsilon subunit 3 n=1 Tax=Elysia marginata TaxID=1093978 RepID=A0AAV4EG60_9GAST|nr:DNA polymerase epsilon subunit 3 [Elysia marginata]